MVNLGNDAEADQVLDEAGKGCDVCHAAQDGFRATEMQLKEGVAAYVTDRL